MKLLYCPHCQDTFNVSHEVKTCSCGRSYGRYIDEINAEISETAVALGFKNSSFVNAMREHIREPNGGWGVDFVGFVIPENSGSIIRRDTNGYQLSSNAWVDEMITKIPTKDEEEKARMDYIRALHEAASGTVEVDI